jgi:hypothetical protein
MPQRSEDAVSAGCPERACLCSTNLSARAVSFFLALSPAREDGLCRIQFIENVEEFHSNGGD